MHDTLLAQELVRWTRYIHHQKNNTNNKKEWTLTAERCPYPQAAAPSLSGATVGGRAF
jgi:hypothetical protein